MWCEGSILRGEAAGAARPATFGRELTASEILATGPWAEAYAEVRADAHQRGFAEGRAEGHGVGAAEGRADVARRAAPVLAALERSVDHLARTEVATVAELAPIVVELALELAGLVLGRELAASTEPARDALRRVLPLVPDRGDLVVRLHPEDSRTLDLADLVPGRSATVVPDPGVAPGDVVVDVGAGRIESRLAETLARVASALRGEVTA